MERILSRKGARVALIVLTVALVALAGCNTGGNGTTVGPTTAPDGNATQTSTPDGNATQTSTPTPTTPAEKVNTSTLASEHLAQIESAGTFTTNVSVHFVTVRNGNETSLSLEQGSFLNLDQKVGLQSLTSTVQSPRLSRTVSGITYTNGNETYRRLNPPGSQQPSYTYGTEPYNRTEPTPINFTSAGGQNLFKNVQVSWTPRGTTTFEGETVTKYTASGTDSLTNITDTLGASFTNISSVNATILVADNGVVRHLNVHISGEIQSGAESSLVVRFTVSDVGSTTVPTPDWLDKARQSS